MPDSEITNLAIGMILAFGVTAALSSAITEGIARFLGLRGAFLLRGLRELLDGSQASTELGLADESYRAVKAFITGQRAATGARSAAEAAPDKLAQPADRSHADAATPSSAIPSATSALLGSPILRRQGMASNGMTLQPPRKPGRLPELTGSGRRQRRSLPTYIPAESFAEAVVDLVVPDATEEITMATVRQDVDALPDEMTALKPSLQALVKNAGNDIGTFRSSVERWYDNQMAHVSREYKRHVAVITLGAGIAIVLLANVNALTIGRSLYAGSTINSGINTAVNSVAARSTACIPERLQNCVDHLRTELTATAQTGLPIGWATVPDCASPGTRCNELDQYGIYSRHGHSGWQAALFLLGLLLTIVALVPGARFWFGLLSKLGNTFG